MSEVWKARDARLNRIVAIKQSHVRFGERFERKAGAIFGSDRLDLITSDARDAP
jgi:hypothetical protein